MQTDCQLGNWLGILLSSEERLPKFFFESGTRFEHGAEIVFAERVEHARLVRDDRRIARLIFDESRFAKIGF